MKTLTAEEFDELADSGQDMSDYLDWDKATRGDTKRINIDLPIDFLAKLDSEATRRGITRQSLIKVWLYDRLHGSETKLGRDTPKRLRPELFLSHGKENAAEILIEEIRTQLSQLSQETHDEMRKWRDQWAIRSEGKQKVRPIKRLQSSEEVEEE